MTHEEYLGRHILKHHVTATRAAFAICKEAGLDPDTDDIQKVVSALGYVMTSLGPSAEGRFRHTWLLAQLARLKAHRDRDYFLKHLLELIDLAKKASDDLVDEVLRAVASDMLERNEPMPPPLRDYIVDALRRPGTKPIPQFAERGGRALRDAFVAHAIEKIVCQTNLGGTRNREQRNQESACSLVTRALHKVGINIDEPSVNEIWRKQKKSLTRQYGAGWREILHKEHLNAESELKLHTTQASQK